MPSLKEIRARIRSVQTTQQTTKAMKMVAASKLRRAQDNIVQFRPYARKLKGLLGNLTASTEGQLSSPYAEANESNTVLLVLITSNRGLCGAFNNQIIKKLARDVETTYAEQAANGKLKLLCIGKRGYDFFRRRSLPLVGQNHDVFAGISFETVNAVASQVMDGYLKGEWGKVVLYYNSFKNVATQIPTADSFLPVSLENLEKGSELKTDYIFEPKKEAMLTQLIPQILRIQFYASCLESNAAEHGARMVAMDNATENAQVLIDDLKLKFNKARQAAITNEILEIVGGAEALSA
ncbi:MAG: ATP synthase F1 subunit gamma [Bacteroidetes bacterium]|jgi:F-type H+-transporting ATPase subunit gamma|nr:ATP synthase F1 subunit gamma [Bacteroidota bacterium]